MAMTSSQYALTFTSESYRSLPRLNAGIGQRSATFRFGRVNGTTGEILPDIMPIRDSPPSLSHDTSRSIKRTLNLSLDPKTAASINPVTDRILPFMIFGDGTEYPLGRYMFATYDRQVYTSGSLVNASLTDEAFIVDQEIDTAFSFGLNVEADNGEQIPAMASVDVAIDRLMFDVPVTRNFEDSGAAAQGSWGRGTSRLKVLEDLALLGDFFSPWFDNHGVMRMIRAFEPNDQAVDFDFDAGYQVKMGSIARSDNLLIAPNRIVVINNDGADDAIIGTYDVPASAPHSALNRGFVITRTVDYQVANPVTAQQLARNIGIRDNVFETVTLNTAPDPRHDSYNIIHWDSEKWFEIAWNMVLIEGGDMQHVLRKTYDG